MSNKDDVVLVSCGNSVDERIRQARELATPWLEWGRRRRRGWIAPAENDDDENEPRPGRSNLCANLLPKCTPPLRAPTRMDKSGLELVISTIIIIIIFIGPKVKRECAKWASL